MAFMSTTTLKKIALLLLSSINSICFDTDCLITLCNIAFFYRQVSNTPIRKMAISITVRGLEANKHTTD